MRVLRRLGAVLLVVGLVGVACDAGDVLRLGVAKSGRRCSGAGFARDSKNVLQCKGGRWRVTMTISRAITLIDVYNASLATTTSATPTTVSTPTPAPKPSVVTAIAAGFAHTCAVKSDGTVWCFGRNNTGQLGSPGGFGAGPPTPNPTLVSGLTEVTGIATGRGHTCALKRDGTVSCFGSNNRGQLGTALPEASTAPIPVPGLSGVTAITAGGEHTCALLSGGTVTCFGDNRVGQAGNPGGSSTSAPTSVPGLSGVTGISAGTDHTCALNADGTVACFGRNQFQQLGNSGPSTATPTVVAGLTGATSVAAGERHTCAVKNVGTIACFGFNYNGQLGNPVGIGTATPTAAPIVVSSLSSVSGVAAGSAFTCALNGGGQLSCFGYNYDGELGSSTNNLTGNANPVPATVSELNGVMAVTAGREHTCVLLSGGTVNCFGSNYYGQLGNSTNLGTTSPNPRPTIVAM